MRNYVNRQPGGSSSRYARLAVLALMLLAALPSAFGHAFIKEPKSRNYAAYLRGDLSSYCPHCMNGAGNEPGEWAGIAAVPHALHACVDHDTIQRRMAPPACVHDACHNPHRSTKRSRVTGVHANRRPSPHHSQVSVATQARTTRP